MKDWEEQIGWGASWGGCNVRVSTFLCRGGCREGKDGRGNREEASHCFGELRYFERTAIVLRDVDRFLGRSVIDLKKQVVVSNMSSSRENFFHFNWNRGWGRITDQGRENVNCETRWEVSSTARVEREKRARVCRAAQLSTARPTKVSCA